MTNKPYESRSQTHDSERSISLFPAFFILGLFIAAGLAGMGYFVFDAILKFKAADRVITVKGLAEQEVDADLLIWPVSFINVNNDLNELQQKIAADKIAIREHLVKSGLRNEEITDLQPVITDYQAQSYMATTDKQPLHRYMSQSVITIRTNQVALAMRIMETIDELFKKGIVLNKNYEQQPEFLFMGLNKIKPEMISKAIHVARETAEQFAKDSNSKIGAIKGAKQGFFEITNRDMNTPHIKNVRVVINVDYLIE